MAESEDKRGTGLPEWTSKEEKHGLDPLGMQTTSIALYQQLLPGIGNVTVRMRYYGFYSWLADTYAKEVGETDVDRWCIYVRRAEALYALTAIHNTGETGVAGTEWATAKLADSNAERIEFHLNTDRDSEHRQYLKQKFGVFGAAYGAQLVEIGLLEYLKDGHEIPVPTAVVGDATAQAFREAIGDAGVSFLNASQLGAVTKTELKLFDCMLPSKISERSVERKLYEDLLFGKSQTHRMGATMRTRTLRLILYAARSEAKSLAANDVRWALYASRNRAGALLPPVPQTDEELRFAWSVYQANDLLHASYEGLMKFSLDILGTKPSGTPMQALVSEVVARVLRALDGIGASTWEQLLSKTSLVENARAPEENGSELRLLNGLLKNAQPPAISDDESACSAVILLAVLHKRFSHLIRGISQAYPVLTVHSYTRSIVTEIKFLESHAQEPLASMLTQLIGQRIIERHIWVAIQKFRQGDYTFLFESDEGKVRVRQKDGPILTNPRLSSAITFLTDIHLLGKQGPTDAGIEVLEAA